MVYQDRITRRRLQGRSLRPGTTPAAFSFPKSIDYTPGPACVPGRTGRTFAAFRQQVPFADGKHPVEAGNSSGAGPRSSALRSPPTGPASPAPPRSAPSRDQMLQCVIEANLRLQEYDQDRTKLPRPRRT